MAEWRYVREDEEAHWISLLWDSDVASDDVYARDSYVPFMNVAARLIGKYAVIRLKWDDCGVECAYFYTAERVGDDALIREKARAILEDAEWQYEDFKKEQRFYTPVYLPREAEGVREW